MKERESGKQHARSSVTGSVIKMKVKKTSEDKQVHTLFSLVPRPLPKSSLGNSLVMRLTCYTDLLSHSTEGHKSQAATELFEQHIDHKSFNSQRQ